VTFHLYRSREYSDATADSNWAFIGYDELLDATPAQAAVRRLAGDQALALRSSTMELQLALIRAGRRGRRCPISSQPVTLPSRALGLMRYQDARRTLVAVRNLRVR
jgi:hypothetical protein